MKKIFILTIFILTSCSVRNIVLQKTSPIIDEGIIEKIYSEDNIIYLRDSLPANLKLLEVLYAKNEDILIVKNLSMGLCGYAYAFWQNEKEIANNFYMKGIKYTEEYIKKHNLKLTKSSDLKTQDLFFAMLFCKMAYIDTNTDQPQAMDMISDVEEISNTIFNINERYFNRFVSAIKAFILASKPKIAGGNIEKARDLFEYSILGEGEEFLLNKYLYMRFAVIMAEEELFDKMYNEIISWENNSYPYAFFNKVAQMKAKRLKEKKDEYF